MNRNQSTYPNNNSAGFDADRDSDSGFFSEAAWEELNAGDMAFDVIHESGKGWCRVVSTVLRGRRVAVKSLREEYADNPLYATMLEKEFELGSRLYHPAVVSYIAMEDLPGLGRSIIMEYIDGIPFSEWLKTHRGDRQESLRILKELCEALSYMHSHGIIHRDLKPSNIMLTSAGRHVKVIDLGMSHTDNFAQLSFPGGTRGYVAPELLEEGAEASVRSDIYSLGVIMREALPYPGRRGRRLIDKCISANAADRPASADEVMEQLCATRRTPRGWIISAAAALAIGAGTATVALMISQRHNRDNNPVNNEEPVPLNPVASDSAQVPIAPTTAISTADVQPAQNPVPGEASAMQEDALISEMMAYARQYTLRRLEEHYGRDNDSLPRVSFPSSDVIREIDRYLAEKCGGTDNPLYNKVKPIATEASFATMREFHSRIYSKAKTPSHKKC